MERVKKVRAEGVFARFLPYLVAILLVLAIEFLYFGAGFSLAMMIFIIVAVLAVGVFLVNPYLAILALFVVKPLVDMMWGVSVAGGWKGTHIIGVLGPLLWGFGMLHFKVSPLKYRLGRTMIFWGACCLLPLILVPFSWNWDPGSIWVGLDIFFRFINGWGFFFLMPFLVRDRKGFNLFLYAWLLSTVIPALFGLYYLLTRNPSGFQITAGWWRIAGPYHDAAAFMTEITPALPIMLYLASGAKKWWKKLLWLVPIGAWLVLVFNAYTRSFWIATAIVLIVWAFAGLWQPAVVAAVGAIYKWPLIWKRLTTAGVEEIESRYAMGGRMGMWEDFWAAFKQSSILDKILGRWAGIKGFGSTLDFHNQYIMTIANLGIIGFLAFFGILVGFLYHLIKDIILRPAWRREALLGLSVLAIAIVLSVSGRFLLVPNNQWFLFGFMGLLINADIERNES